MTAQEKERITRLRGEGKSYGAIATLLGISASKVKSYCTMAKSITRIDVKKQDLLQRKRVAAYARVSMDTERLMHSLSVQVSYYSELIQNTPGWEYAGVYADEGISGTKMDSRPEFVRMLADCKAGKIDSILTKSLSRFARNTVDTLNVVRRLKELGIEVRFEKERINSLADEGELLITIMASFAQEEVRSLSENVKRGLRKRFEQGMPNGRFHVYGYRWEGDHLVIRPDEAAIVRRIFQNFLQGKSRLETEREFAAEGITTAKGCRWVDSNIKVVLTNVTYTGNLLLQKEYITDPITKKRKKNRGELTQYYVEGTHEAIIDKETFDYVQQEMARRKALGPRANKSLNLTCFSGKIRCPHCGINYGHLRPRRGSLISYWVCGSKRKKKVGDGCPVKGAMSEVAIRKCCAEALGLDEFDETVFTERVDHLEVPEKDRLTFFMKDGRTFTRDCRNTGHQDCWTPEYRAAVSAYRREHGTNPRGKSCFTSKIKCACGSNYQTSYQKLKDGAIRYWRCPEKCCEKGMREDRLRAVCAEVLDTDGFDEAAFTAQVEYISVLADGVLESHLANGRAVQHSIDLRRSGTKWSEVQRRRFDESIKGPTPRNAGRR